MSDFTKTCFKSFIFETYILCQIFLTICPKCSWDWQVLSQLPPQHLPSIIVKSIAGYIGFRILITVGSLYMCRDPSYSVWLHFPFIKNINNKTLLSLLTSSSSSNQDPPYHHLHLQQPLCKNIYPPLLENVSPPSVRQSYSPPNWTLENVFMKLQPK